MEKSMAGKGAAGALLLAGLMMSAGAMAASGDPVTGGSGTVTINVPIVTSTCSVTMSTEVNLQPVNPKSLLDESFRNDGSVENLSQNNMNITFSGCSGKTLQMTTQAHLIAPYDISIGFFSSGDQNHRLMYKFLAPKAEGITGGFSYDSSYFLMLMNNTKPLIIKPNSDSYVIASIILLIAYKSKNAAVLGSAVSGGFDYTFTYQ
ncbi:hypothetical protein PUZ95_004623 [Salmonella enterica]|nr:hypothetical protein [Salmonella enterica]